MVNGTVCGILALIMIIETTNINQFVFYLPILTFALLASIYLAVS